MITHLAVTDFRAIRGTREYDLPQGITVLAGRNEKGKTSSVLAIAYALYGAQAMPEGITADDLINDHAKKCEVTVHLEHNGDSFVLNRWQDRNGRGDATLTKNGGPHATGRAPVTKAIEQLFGVDHVGFLISVFARQKELDALASKKGAERVTTILRFIGVDQAESATKAIRKDANEERRRLEVLRASVGDVEEMESRLTADRNALDDLRRQLTAAEAIVAERSASVDAARAELERLRPQKEAREEWLQRLAQAKGDEATARVRLQDAQQRVVIVPPRPEPPE